MFLSRIPFTHLALLAGSRTDYEPPQRRRAGGLDTVQASFAVKLILEVTRLNLVIQAGGDIKNRSRALKQISCNDSLTRYHAMTNPSVNGP